jgi:Pregnancy-associated plasma protein-A
MARISVAAVCILSLATGMLISERSVGQEQSAKAKFSLNSLEFDSQEAFVKQGRRCGTPQVSVAQRLNIMARVRRFAEKNAEFLRERAEPIKIPVAFHIIHDGNDGRVDEARVDKQLQVLNDAFGKHGIEFSKKAVKFTDNAAWFEMDLDTTAEAEAKTKLGTDQERMLNFYTCQPPGGTLGWARFPWELATAPRLDGVVVLHSSLPDGDADPYHLGDTAVHEVGHWLGLFHTFGENPFDPCIDTDEVTDTPAHHVNFGKPPETTDTCTDKPGNDPVRNFMNYVDDDWMDHFTQQQVARLHEYIGLFRPLLLPSDVRSRLEQ